LTLLDYSAGNLHANGLFPNARLCLAKKLINQFGFQPGSMPGKAAP